MVEDEGRLREMLASAIVKMGFEVTTAATAETAVRLAKQKGFDIVVLDLNLPGESGLELLERIRRGGVSDRDRNVQAIILTGFGDLAAARKAIHLDVVEFLTKPCSLGDLETALGRAFGRRRSQSVEMGSGPAAFATEKRAEEPKGQGTSDSKGVSASGVSASTSATALEDIEREHILGTLEKHQGNRAATASELGISLRKLYYRLNEYQRKGQL